MKVVSVRGGGAHQGDCVAAAADGRYCVWRRRAGCGPLRRGVRPRCPPGAALHTTAAKSSAGGERCGPGRAGLAWLCSAGPARRLSQHNHSTATPACPANTHNHHTSQTTQLLFCLLTPTYTSQLLLSHSGTTALQCTHCRAARLW